MRLLLIAGLVLAASPAMADFDSLQAKTANTHAIAERARQAGHEARADKQRADQAAIDRSCAKIGGARVGMNAEGVLKSCWGKPTRVNTTTTARGKYEQWVYGDEYLYLENGVVTSIQTSR